MREPNQENLSTALIESVLLVSPGPVTLPALLSATQVPESEARVAIEDLKGRYSPSSSGIVLREVAGGFQLATNPRCAKGYCDSEDWRPSAPSCSSSSDSRSDLVRSV